MRNIQPFIEHKVREMGVKNSRLTAGAQPILECREWATNSVCYYELKGGRGKQLRCKFIIKKVNETS